VPWTATLTYVPARIDQLREDVCAENTQFYPQKNAAVPTADEPDF